MDTPSILLENLSSDNRKLAFLSRRFAYYADEIAKELLGENQSATDEELELSYREIRDTLEAAFLSQDHAFSLSLLSAEGAILAAEIAKALTRRAKIESFLPTLDSVEGKCVYFRNAYSDDAYRIFAPYLTSPTASYSDTPLAASAEVYNDQSNFAILPIHSSKEGKISGILRGIERFALSPVLYTDVTLPGGDETMTMGLFAAYPMAIENAEGIEITLFSDDAATLPAFHLATSVLDCPILSIKTLDERQGFANAYRINIDCREKDALLPLWLLLRCEYPHHQLSGIFKTVYKK